MNKTNKVAIIIGAGPAGLTAGYELCTRSDIHPVVLEQEDAFGGISKTVNYKGNRMDLGGHRFFSKSERVMKWWSKFLNFEITQSGKDSTLHEKEKHEIVTEDSDKIMLQRNRLSRILYLGYLFDYPIQLSWKTIKYLGIKRITKISLSYFYTRVFPLQEEKNLEDFFINRFGRELYNTFFKDYTEKVWGVSCREIKPEWGAQRIKGLSLRKTVTHALSTSKRNKGIHQNKIETSLIEKFLYPKYGPGQLWDIVADQIRKNGGEIRKSHEVIGITWINNDSVEVSVKDKRSGSVNKISGNYLISSMPIKDLIGCMGEKVPSEVKHISNELLYRDFITVGLLLKDLSLSKNNHKNGTNNTPLDNWIYIQETNVSIGRLQIFNNWSPYLVANKENIWVGLEYFCNEGDELWSMPDENFKNFAIQELIKLNMIKKNDVLDSTIVRVKKAYPAYFGSYEKMGTIQSYLSGLKNIFPVGRNGMHKYNNQDHSMLTAMVSVDNIIMGTDIDVWGINTENLYHEENIKNNEKAENI